MSLRKAGARYDMTAAINLPITPCYPLLTLVGPSPPLTVPIRGGHQASVESGMAEGISAPAETSLAACHKPSAPPPPDHLSSLRMLASQACATWLSRREGVMGNGGN